MFPSHFTAARRQNERVSKRHLRIAGTAALMVGMGLGPAVAAEKPKPTPKPDARMMTMAQPKMTPTEMYRSQMLAYTAAVKARQASIDAINQAFADAVKRAQTDFKVARKSATTAELKASAETTRDAAISAATAARQAAINALGPIPLKPMKPAPEPTSTP